MTKITAFSTFPDYKSYTNKTDYANAVLVWLLQLITFQTQFNTVVDEVNDAVDDVTTKAAQVTTDAATSAQNALLAQDSVNYQGVWTPKGYSANMSVKGSNGVRYRCDITHTDAKDPTDPANKDYWSVSAYAGAIGAINNPLFSLIAKNSLAMRAGVGSVKYFIATASTYINRYGRDAIQDIDKPRFTKDGVLIEGASSNYIINYNSFLYTGYTTSSSGFLLDGETPATLYTHDGSGSYRLIANTTFDALDLTTGGVSSIRVKKDTTDVNYAILLSSNSSNYVRVRFTFSTMVVDNISMIGNIVNARASMYYEGEDWYRIYIYAESPDTAWKMGVYAGIYSAQVAGDSIFVYHNQLESRPYPSSVIPTSGSIAYRAYSEAYFDALENVPNLKKGGTLHFEFVLYGGVDITPRFFSINFSDTQDIRPYFNATTGVLQLYAVDKNSNAISAAISSSIVLGKKQTITLVFQDDGNLATYTNGIFTDLTNTGFFLNMDFSKMTNFVLGKRSIGANYTGDATIAFSLIESYDIPFNAAQVALLGGNNQ